MSEDETYQLIENYLSGALGKEEKSAFEKQLFTNTELSKQVRLHQLANELVIENRLQSVKSILLEEKNKGNSGNNLTKIIFSVALLIVGTLLFVTWKNKKNNIESKPSANELATSGTETTASITESIIVTKNSTTLHKNQLAEEKQSNTLSILPDQPLPQIKTDLLTAETTEEKTNPTRELPIQTPVQEKLNTGPCAGVQLNAKVSTTASCEEESNGSIMVREFAGGTAPYSVAIKNKQQEYVSSLNIPVGNYTVLIQDKKGCSNTFYNIQVPEKLCEKEYTFNPFMDELLTLPSQEQHGTLTIYERSGNAYFTKEIEPLETIQWNGYSKSGELTAGYFIFVLTLKDGQAIRGGITIVR